MVGVEFPKTYQPTIISTYTREMEVEGVQFHVDIVDTAGQVSRALARRRLPAPPCSRAARPQDEYTQIPKEAAIGVHGYVLVYDSSSRDSFLQVCGRGQRGTDSVPHCTPRVVQMKNIRDSLLETLGTDSVPMVLVANKADIQPPCVLRRNAAGAKRTRHSRPLATGV